MKKYNQSKKTKDEFLKKSYLYAYMKGYENVAIYKSDLMGVLDVRSDRQIRKRLAELANYCPIVATSDAKGYRLLQINDEMGEEELKEIYDDAQHQINELQARIDNLKARMKPLVALQKVIEKKVTTNPSDE